ncbi:MAG TPA: PH domain-containing protein [Bryobacteraceae bacterium]|nr:PH domain-containing protein [Bryobacteraceae bacterium]
MKFINAGYIITLLVVAAGIVLTYQYLPPSYPTWLPALWLILFLWPIKRHIQRQAIKMTISGDKLRYETGLGSKSTRIIQLPKVQDVRVVQSIMQRMLGVGDISIETAGESSRLVLDNIDQPQQLAEQITDLSGHVSGTGLH